MADDGKALVGGMIAGTAVLAAGFAQTALSSIEAARQAKLERIDELNAAREAAHISGMQIAHADALRLAKAALEHIADLEAENAMLRKAIVSRDRILRSRAHV
ncbi:hypothetical protein J0X15_15855 [Roseibium sp. CAU 1637]|uniref:Uncharacterized protein n=1 Tax=Roseibium limicola TaxID=2816037 RepID=A0A939JAR5_9HYPH|nr:hypothetical protein [Roseibium limicola]MBO0346703.1 hypothetical protein [Roseibium limicola]